MILDVLQNKTTWEIFFNEKFSNSLNVTENENRRYYLENYMAIVNNFINNNFSFTSPKLNQINKKYTSRKRYIYIFNKDDLLIQKYIAWYMHKYDNILSNNCIAYKKCNFKTKLFKLLNNISDNDYAYKLDISDYFNSINIDKLLEILNNVIDDELLLSILTKYLNIDYVYIDNRLTKIQHGIFTGSPLSGFLANIYLKDLDNSLDNNNIQFLRYSDDILVVGSVEDINNAKTIITNYFENISLKINHDKEFTYAPGEKIEFLGFSYQNKIIDISNNSRHKLFNKIRRIAREQRRNYLKNNLLYEDALKNFFDTINKILYKNNIGRTWATWYLPIINTNNTLIEIDKYILMYARYIYSGNFSKSNFKIKDSQLRKNGYISLTQKLCIF